jgi:hypothetical protein
MLVYIQCELNSLVIETGRIPEAREREEKRKTKNEPTPKKGVLT